MGYAETPGVKIEKCVSEATQNELVWHTDQALREVFDESGGDIQAFGSTLSRAVEFNALWRWRFEDGFRRIIRR